MKDFKNYALISPFLLKYIRLGYTYITETNCMKIPLTKGGIFFYMHTALCYGDLRIF